MTQTAELVEFVRGTQSVPSDVVERSKLVIRDYFGVAAYGATTEVGDTLRAYAAVSPVEGLSPVVDGTTAGRERACLLNGVFGHAVDYDDTFSSFPLHPTTVVTPATLAAGETVNADGGEFLRAFAAGVEVLYRAGHSVFPTQYDRGFHSTAAVGPLGAAAAAGVLLGLDDEHLRNAFGIAASSAGGLRKNFGTTTKPLHAGFAASAGLRAALLADAGATADPDVLDGKMGYGATMADDDYDPSWFAGETGDGVGDIALKLFPSAHITHGVMEALGRLRKRENLMPEDVASMTATMHPGGRDVLLHSDPRTGLEAKFSIEFCLAAVLRTGLPGFAAFTDDYVAEPETRSAMACVDAVYDADAVGDLGRYGGIVTVETTNGETYEEAADAPGSPENPASEYRLREKFDACVAPTTLDGDRLTAAVEGLTDGGSVGGLVTALRVE